ncbi:MAG: WXG100 family type VII secretion target [Pseudonocardiales bacterium]|nr:MAG: WXG100 family type VII secretion target [Pseudonocardiales bacterium]
MSSSFAVDLEILQDVIDRMSTFERVLEERLDDVDGRVRRLHQAWAGAAADEHVRAHQEWLAGAQQMRTAIATLRRIGATAHANYAAAIAANRRMWG